MRWLVTVAAGWTAGILVAGVVGGPWLVWLGILVGALSARRWPGVALVAAAVAAGGFAAAWQRAHVAPVDSPGLIVEGVVARPSDDADGVRHTLVDLDGIVGADGVTGVAGRVQVSETTPLAVVRPGDRVRVAGELHAPRGYVDEGAFDRARFAAGRGIDAVLAARPPGLVIVDAPAGWSPWRGAALARERMAAALACASGGDGAALLQDLVLGRRAGVRPTLANDFRAAGVAHVLCVSGLHLAVVTWIVFAFLRRAWLRLPWLALAFPADRAAALAAMPAAIAYTMITGAEVATVRCLGCTLVVLTGTALLRRADALTALAITALAVLIDSPLVVYEPSFQLSFVATGALAVLAGRWRGVGASRIARYVTRAVGASLVAAAVTAPLTALAFGVVQPAGVFANLVVVPLAELVVLPIGLAGAIAGALWTPLGAPLVACANFAAELLARLVEFFAAHAPTWEVAPPRPLELLLFAAAGGLFAFLSLRRAVLPAALLVTIAVVSCGHRFGPGSATEITFLDVGQGDSAVIESPDEVWLVDAGGRLFGGSSSAATEDERLAAAAGDVGEQAVWPFLRARRITRLDVVVLSHPHPDHYGGLPALLDHVEVGEVWVTGAGASPSVMRLLAARGIPVRHPGVGFAREAGGARLSVIAAPIPDGDLRHANDDSLVVRLDVNGRSALFPGDVEARGEAGLLSREIAPVDIVKVPHHGSRTSSSSGLVAATHPSLAVISCGAHNHFGFPAASVVARWLSAGATVLRTDRDGAVTVRIDPSGALSVSRAVGEAAAPVTRIAR